MTVESRGVARRLAAPAALRGSTDRGAVRLEMKPYLRPFEEGLARREVRALLLPGETFVERGGQGFVETRRDESVFADALTYWQRVGRGELRLTKQAAFERTQTPGGRGGARLHAARRLRYGPHDLHEYRGKFFPQLARSLLTISGSRPGGIVLDPMCGSGTTPCEAVASGRHALAMDLNPLSVLVSRAKAAVPTVTVERLVPVLRSWSEVDTVRAAEPAETWPARDLDYLRRWFAPQALAELAGLRRAVEGVSPGVERDVLLACLSDVLRSVSWQKEDDLRVRKEVRAYARGDALRRLREKVRDQADRIDPYLRALGAPSPGSADVRQGDCTTVAAGFREYLGRVDVLLTSPPYATALPYLDTDRLSLVVLGLAGRDGIRDLEASMIGTREVTESRRAADWEAFLATRSELPTSVVDFVTGLARSYHRPGVGFRRRNLPALLGRYFSTMLRAMREALPLMRPGAPAYYVVGTNSTVVDGARVEIPTDRFLRDLGRAAGWADEDAVPMELLASRDLFRKNRGSKETILCFRAPRRRARRTAIFSRAPESARPPSSGEWDFPDADTGESLHSLHPYPAKFIPQIPRRAIETWTAPGEAVLDPFCGCGTTLLEASRLGRPSIGLDNNAVAWLASRAKTTVYTAADERRTARFLDGLPGRLEGVDPRAFRPSDDLVGYWYDPGVADRLARLKGAVRSEPEPVRTLLSAVFSSLLVRLSKQDSDTRYARVEREVSPADVDAAFARKTRETLRALPSLREGATSRAPVAVRLADARARPEIERASVALIVTSPPYLNAYDYHKYHRQRLHWIDGDVAFARDMEIGKHDRFTRPGATPDAYFADMDACFSWWPDVLRPGGRCLLVAGDAIVSRRSVPVADRFVEMLAARGLALERRWVRRLPPTRRSFNVANARMSSEHVLLFRSS